MFEALENRRLLSVMLTGDGGETFAAASPLGKLQGATTINNRLAAGENDEFYSFTVRSRGNVYVSLGGLQANANIRLFDADGRLLGFSGRPHARFEAIARTLKRGTYMVSVDRARRAADTPYSLGIQADMNVETVAIDGGTYTLAINRED